MASKTAIEAGRAFVRLFLKNDFSSQLARTLRQAGEKLKNFGRNAVMGGVKMAAAGAAIAAPLVLGLKEFANFDAVMGNVATMLDKPEDFIPGFAQGIRDMAIEFGKTKQDLATGLYDLLSATVPPEKAMERLAAATKLAAAGNAEVGSSVAVLNTLMDTYGDSFTDAGDATDFLFAIVKRGRTNLPELAGKLGDIIATAKAAGMSVEDMGASAALLTRATGGTDSALTALNAISASFLKPSAEGARVWEEKFGGAMDTATLQTIGMTGVLERLKTLSAGDIAKIFPNLRAIRGIFPAIEKMQGFGDDLKAMSDRAGNVGVAFEKIKGPLFYWNQGLEMSKNVLLEIGGALAEAILPYREPIMQIGKAVAAWIAANKGVVVTIGMIAAGLIAGGTALAAFGFAAMGIGTALSVLAGVVTALFSPVGLITAAVVAATVAFFKWTESGQAAYQYLSDSFAKLLAWAQEVFGGIRDAMAADDMQLAAEILWAGIKVAWTKGMAWVKSQWATLDAHLATASVELKSTLLGSLRKLWMEIVAGFWGTIDKVVDAWDYLRETSERGVVFLESTIKGRNPWDAMKGLEKGHEYDRQQRQASREERDRANANAYDSETAANDAAKQERLSEIAADRFLAITAAENDLDAARSLLAQSIDAAKTKRAETEKAKAASAPSGAAAGAASGPQVGPAGATAQRGVALTATYSAAAARIAGYQPGAGPQEKMATGIAGVEKNTAELVRQFVLFSFGFRVQ